MPALNSTQLQKLAATRQHSEWFVSVFQPATVLVAQITGPFEHGARKLTYTTVSGSYANVLPNMTALIGTSAGAEDIGRIRVRSATASEITVAENSFTWESWHLTVLRYWEIWPVYPRVQANGDLQIWVDYDVAYTNQNSYPPPVVNMGPAVVGYAPLTVWWDASKSFAMRNGESIASYAWTFEGGSPASSTAQTPGYVTWDTAGFYWVELTVTDTAGTSATSRRPVIVHDDNTPPLKAVRVDNLFGSWEDGGWSLEVTVYQDVKDQVKDRALVVLWRNSYYNGEKYNISQHYGADDPRSAIVFVGYIDGESIRTNAYDNTITFRALGPAPYMRNISNFPVTLEYSESPDTWWKTPNLTIDRAVYYYLKWYTTALEVCDFDLSSYPNEAKYIDFEEGSVFDAVNTLAYNKGGFVKFGSDMYGRLFLDRDVDIHTGTWTAVCELNDAHWRDELEIEVAHRTQVNWVELNGVYWDGVEARPVISMAPGDAPLPEGRSMTVSGLITPPQADLNKMAGQYLAAKNKRFPNVTVPLALNWSGAFDVFRQNVVLLNLSAKKNRRGYVWTSKPFVIREVTHTFDGETRTVQSSITCSEIVYGKPGVDGRYPPEPPEELPPPPPPIEPPVPGEPPPSGDWSRTVMVATANRGIFITRDFRGTDDPSYQPTWTPLNEGFYGKAVELIADPFNPTSRWWCLVNTDGNEQGAVLVRHGLDDVWKKLFDGSDVMKIMHGSATDGYPYAAKLIGSDNAWYYRFLHASINRKDLLYVGVKVIKGTHQFPTVFYTSNGGYVWDDWSILHKGPDLFNARVVNGENQDFGGPDNLITYYTWAHAGSGVGSGVYRVQLDTPELATQISIPDGIDMEYGLISIDPGRPDVIYITDTYGGGFYKSTDSGSTWTKILDLSAFYPNFKVAQYTSNVRVFNGAGKAAKEIMLVMHPESNPVLFYTWDGGTSWKRFRLVGSELQRLLNYWAPLTTKFGISIVQSDPYNFFLFVNAGMPYASWYNNGHALYVGRLDPTLPNMSDIEVYPKAGPDTTTSTTTGIPADCGAITAIVQIYGL